MKNKALFLCILLINTFYSCAIVDQGDDIVSKEIVEHYNRSFIKSVSWKRTEINLTPEKLIFWTVEKKGYNAYSRKCIPLSYSFFSRIKDDVYLKKIIKVMVDSYLDCVNSIIQRFYREKPSDINTLCRITHEEIVKHALFPKHITIDKQMLIIHPELYEKAAHQLKMEDRDALIAAGLFARYWLEEVKRVVKG